MIREIREEREAADFKQLFESRQGVVDGGA